MTTRLPVTDASYVAGTRREVEARARAINLGPDEVARAALIATELSTNLVRHGGGGEILVRPLPTPEVTGLELIAIDRGPGIRDIGESLRDGISTRGTSGTGLGAIRRQADEFDITSAPKQGTAVLARVWPGRKPMAETGVQVGVVCVAKAGEEMCGDAWAVLPGHTTTAALVADGLGHGPLASQASQEARRLFMRGDTPSPNEAIRKIHAGLGATRGAAVAVASLDLAANRVVFSGIGNIAGLVTAGGHTRRFVSMNGIAGHAAERFQEFIYPCEGPGLVLVLHSDGLSTNWAFDRYTGLMARHPALIASVLYRDAGRSRDDATVLVLKRAP
ncbi:MAG TPA: ATP-binding SpoIIE family protein phosphatase [Reyranella sp.]